MRLINNDCILRLVEQEQERREKAKLQELLYSMDDDELNAYKNKLKEIITKEREKELGLGWLNDKNEGKYEK